MRNKLYIYADKKFVEKSKHFFKTGKGEYSEHDQLLGICVPKIRSLLKEEKHNLNIEITKKILVSKFHKERLFTVLILVHLFKIGNSKDQKHIFQVYLSHTAYINNWDIIDLSAAAIVGAFLYTDSKKKLLFLIRSENIWERRIAIIAIHFFIRNNNFDDALQLIELCIKDKEDLIHKACG